MTDSGAMWVMAGAVLVLVAASVALIWQGALAAGIAMLVLAIAVSGPLFGRTRGRSQKDAD